MFSLYILRVRQTYVTLKYRMQLISYRKTNKTKDSSQ